MISKALVVTMTIFLSQAAIAQTKPGSFQRVAPEQEYEMMKDRFHTLKRASKQRVLTWNPGKAGEMNPLELLTLNEPLIFINGQDEAQVSKATEILKSHNGAAKVIVVGPIGQEVARMAKGKAYSDLRGKFAKKLGIQHGPALVTQESKQLRIEEIVP